jgi:hypothetical protein
MPLISIFGGSSSVDWDDIENKPAELAIDKANQAEAEAGLDDTKWMSPLMTAYAIAALGGGGGGGGEANTAANLGVTTYGWFDSKVGVQLRFKSATPSGLVVLTASATEIDIGVPAASQAEAEAGTDNAKALTSLRVKQAITSYGMLVATYDPTAVAGDAFDMDNMVEGANTKILTSAERTKLGHITVTQAVDLDAIETNSAASKVKTDWITVTQAVDLDSMETQAAAGAAAKVKTDFLTVTQAVDLDTMETQVAAIKVKADFITVTQAVDLDDIEADATSAVTKTDFLTVTQAVDLDTLESQFAGVKTKTDFITVTQAVDLDTIETQAAAGAAAKVKTDFLTVTQAVDLDTLESDFAAVKAKTDLITVSDPTSLDALEDLQALLAGGTTGQFLKKASNTDYDFAWQTISGGGDMLAATYDPGNVAGDAFDMDNMVEGTDTKIFTGAERTKLGHITVTQAVDLDAIETNSAASKVKTDFITITQAIDLDAVETSANLVSGIKTKTDFITITQAVDLDALEASVATALQQGLQTVYIPANGMVKRTSNGPADYSLETTTNKVMVTGLAFDAATDEFAQFDWEFPKSWNLGTITAVFHWHAPSGTGNVVWAIQGLALSDSDVLDTAFGTAQTVTDAIEATTDTMRTAATGAVTIAGTPAASDRVIFQVYRDADNGSDTFSADAVLLGVTVFYTTNANTDA